MAVALLKNRVARYIRPSVGLHSGAASLQALTSPKLQAGRGFEESSCWQLTGRFINLLAGLLTKAICNNFVTLRGIMFEVLRLFLYSLLPLSRTDVLFAG